MKLVRETMRSCFAATLLLATTMASQTPPRRSVDIDRRETSCGDKSVKILILGSYHMDSPNLDSLNTQADDVLSGKRQKEIAELVEKLARFGATKIAIEAPYGSSSWPDLYRKYLAGEYKLGRNEIEQIGFQVAKRLKLPTLYPVDFPMFMSGLTPSEVEQTKVPKAAPEAGGNQVRKPEPPPLSDTDKLLRRSTVGEFLMFLNSQAQIQAGHSGYMEMLMPNDNPAIYARADLVTNWYKRNLRIFANLCRITEFPGDRVLLIIGSGHLKILTDFALDAPQFCLADTRAYLK
ncbi:MAG: DUF5694 domain-containing protein [Candidatus Aminicenantales bacterium]